MANKRGAVELSMSTIIVVILGVTLLSLGLLWVRSSLNRITDLSDEAFSLSEEEIDNLFLTSDSLLKIIPSDVELSKGDSIKVGVIFYNLEQSTLNIQAKVIPISAGVPVKCSFGDTLTQDSKSYNLNSGASETIDLVIETVPETTLGTGGCDVTITSLTSSQTSYSLSEQALVDIKG